MSAAGLTKNSAAGSGSGGSCVSPTYGWAAPGTVTQQSTAAPVAQGDAAEAEAVFTLTMTGSDGTAQPMALLLDCRTVGQTEPLVVVVVAPADQLAQEPPAFLAIDRGIVVNPIRVSTRSPGAGKHAARSHIGGGATRLRSAVCRRWSPAGGEASRGATKRLKWQGRHEVCPAVSTSAPLDGADIVSALHNSLKFGQRVC